MRVFGCLLLALAVLSGDAVRAQTSDRPIIPSDRLQVHAAIEPASAKAGTPIVVKLIAKNIWYNTVTVSDYGAEVDYGLIVVDSLGKEAPRTRLGNQVFRREYILLRTAVTYLEVGQEIRAEIDVTKIFQLTQPGIYYMWATRDPFPGSPDEPKLTGDLSKLPIERAFSNPVQFTIVP
jgi:hypothetical protein